MMHRCHTLSLLFVAAVRGNTTFIVSNINVCLRPTESSSSFNCWFGSVDNFPHRLGAKSCDPLRHLVDPRGKPRCKTASKPARLRTGLTRRHMMPPTAASILSGSLAGAIGIGVAFPFDTLTTRAQLKRQQPKKKQSPRKPIHSRPSSGGLLASDTVASTMGDDDLNTAEVFRELLRTEGIGGFFHGVRTMIIGQALIKAVAFSANYFALSLIQHNVSAEASSSVVGLLAAACFAGFVSSFLVTPVERIKITMQVGTGPSRYQNEVDCAIHVVANEGWEGLLQRGLGPTLAREVPGCAVYFAVYGLLDRSGMAETLGSWGPALFGAMSGCACWIPVYPMDLVKTLVQNSGTEDVAAWDIAKTLYEQRGIGAFFDGIDTKLARAAINHAITFWLYDLAIRCLTGDTF